MAPTRVTPTRVLSRSSAQTGGLVNARRFHSLLAPVPIGTAADIGYLLKTRRDGWRSLPDLIGRDELKNWIQYVANTISFETASGAIKELVSSEDPATAFFSGGNSKRCRGDPALARDIATMCDCRSTASPTCS